MSQIKVRGMSETLQLKGAVTKQVMELPRHKNGDVDWNTLGNILVAFDLGEVVRASYVDRLYGKSNPGFEAMTDWRFLYKEKDVVVLRKQLEDSPVQCYMGRSVVDLPASVIHGFLAVTESAHHFDKFVVESKLITGLRDEMDIKDGICYMQHESVHCLVKAKRDFVFYSRWQTMNDGKCVLSCLSVDYPDFPPVPGITRGQFRPGSGWVLEPYNGDPNRTLVSHIVHVDLVTLPPLITNRVMRRIPLAVHYLREHLLHNPPRPPSQLPVPPTPERLPEFELPTSPQIPTPNVPQETYCNLSSLPMESNPLYQSSNMYIGSTRLRTQTQESWQLRGTENVPVVKPTRQVSTVPEEVPEENEDEIDCAVVLSTTLIDSELDTSHGFPAPFDMTTSSASLAKSKQSINKEQWLLVRSPTATNHSQEVKNVDDVTRDVSSHNSQGNEWTVVNNE